LNPKYTNPANLRGKFEKVARLQWFKVDKAYHVFFNSALKKRFFVRLNREEMH
jgi:hypothetical protein